MILIVVASLNENMKLAKVLSNQLNALGKNNEIIDLVSLNLPLYDSLKEQNDGIPKLANDLLEKMKKAEGFIVVSPEYNYGIPPVLVNTIAWVSRIGDDFREAFTLKKVQLATHSGGGGLDVLISIRAQLTRLGSIIMPREIVTTYQNSLNEDSSKRILEQYVSVLKD